MDWILIGTVAGSLITAQFATKEACMGRLATLKEQKIEAIKCVEMPRAFSGNALITPGTTICFQDRC